MTDNRLDCDIVQDLLPSYADGLTRETTNKAVEAHLAQCSSCAETLLLMKEPEKRENQTVEVDYLKKVHRRMSHVGMICGIVMMLIGMFTIFAKVFLIGNLANADEVNYQIYVSGQTVYTTLNLKSSTSAIARVVFEESAGIVNVKVYTAPKAFFNKGVVEKTYTAHNDVVGMVRSNASILWQDGISISPMTSKLFANQNPYVGDISGNGRIATILGVMDQFGSCTTELQTSTEPYGWILNLENTLQSIDENAAKEVMTADSYVMLACINNLGYVTWRYNTEGNQQIYTVTQEEASSYVRGDIKNCYTSITELEALIQSLSMKWSSVRETLQETGKFCINLCNYSTEDIYGIEMNYYIGDNLIGTRVFNNEDDSVWKQNEEYFFEFTPENFKQDTLASDLLNFHFDLSVIDKDGRKAEVCKDRILQARYAWLYFYSLTGDYEEGFTLNEG